MITKQKHISDSKVTRHKLVQWPFYREMKKLQLVYYNVFIKHSTKKKKPKLWKNYLVQSRQQWPLIFPYNKKKKVIYLNFFLFYF